MAPEKRNTAKISLDTIAAIRGLFGSIHHVHEILKLAEVSITPRRFTIAMNHSFVTPAEAHAIETHWSRWKEQYLMPDCHFRTEFSLPDDQLLSSRVSNAFDDEKENEE